ncbi:MAG: hypothetical protein ABIS36_17575 [Chryseolinea sp.]
MNTSKFVFKSRPKSSHIMLLSILATLLVLLSSFVLVVNYKIKNSDFTDVNHDKSKYESFKLKRGQVVSIKRIKSCEVVSTDSARIEISSDELQGYTLLTEGDTVYVSGGRKMADIMKKHVRLYVPSNTLIIADSSGIEMRGALSDADHLNFKITLAKSVLKSSASEYHTFFEKLSVISDGKSQVEISGPVHIQELSLADVYDIQLNQTWQIGKFIMSFKDGNGLGITQSGGVLNAKQSPAKQRLSN